MRLSVPAALLVLGLLAGCATVQPVPTTVVTPGMPNPEVALRQSMQHVDAEMAELGQLTPTAAAPSTPVIPEDLQRIVSFKWNGPLDQAVAKLAQSIGYTFYTTAPPNAQPVAVAIEIASVPAYQVFQALGEEAGTRRHRRGRSAPPPGAGDPSCVGSALCRRCDDHRRCSPLAGRRSADGSLTSPRVPPDPTPGQVEQNVPGSRPTR